MAFGTWKRGGEGEKSGIWYMEKRGGGGERWGFLAHIFSCNFQDQKRCVKGAWAVANLPARDPVARCSWFPLRGA